MDWLRCQGWSVQAAAGDPGMFAVRFDLVALSLIFSWVAPKAREVPLRVKDHSEVWCGGPGAFASKSWWHQETGLAIHSGLCWEFERQRGRYQMAFASRGCPVGCSFCVIPGLEGRDFTLNREFTPAPILYDNNLSALPTDFQEHIIRRYQETGQELLDANRGFEPRSFTEDTFHRWDPLLKGPWRFALDDLSERQEREYIQKSLDVLTRATGSAPLGWLGPEYGESVRTPQLLAEAGIRYVCDWANDEQPYRIHTPKGELFALPVMLELDDINALWGRHVAIDRYGELLMESFDTLHRDGAQNGRLLVLNLHPWIIGQPFRIRYLDRALAHMTRRQGVWAATGSDIIDWYSRNSPTA